jgi:hypothetical protein
MMRKESLCDHVTSVEVLARVGPVFGLPFTIQLNVNANAWPHLYWKTRTGWSGFQGIAFFSL